MQKLGIYAVIACLFSAPPLYADIIECPGALPTASLEREEVKPDAERMLQRFMAAFGLYGLGIDLIDERRIIESYGEHPEQLLVKLTYLSLQCQILFLDRSGASKQTKRDELRKAFLDYVLSKPAFSAADLAGYVHQAAIKAKEEPHEGAIADVEEQRKASRRQQWRKTWYPNGHRLQPEPIDRSAVLVATPCHEDDGWAMLRSFQELWPDIYFELRGPADDSHPHFALIVGRGLTPGTADGLLKQIQEKGFPKNSRVINGSGKNEETASSEAVCANHSKGALVAWPKQPVNDPGSD